MLDRMTESEKETEELQAALSRSAEEVASLTDRLRSTEEARAGLHYELVSLKKEHGLVDREKASLASSFVELTEAHEKLKHEVCYIVVNGGIRFLFTVLLA